MFDVVLGRTYDDFLVDNVHAAVVVLVEEPGYEAGDDG